MLYLFAFEHVHKLPMYGNGHVNQDMVCKVVSEDGLAVRYDYLLGRSLSCLEARLY